MSKIQYSKVQGNYSFYYVLHIPSYFITVTMLILANKNNEFENINCFNSIFNYNSKNNKTKL